MTLKKVTVRAAARVDLAGGSLDLWPLGQIIPGSTTVNVAISLAANVECVPTGEEGVHLASRDLLKAYTWRAGAAPGPLALLERFCAAFGVTDGWRIQAWSDVPPGSGLGGSSAMSVAVAMALARVAGKEMEPGGLVALCRDLEAANLGIPTGVQDFWPAVRGGVLCIRYEPGGDKVESLAVPLRELASRLVVAYTGESRLSARTNWALVKGFLDGDPEVRTRLEGIASVARRLRERLEAGDLDACGPLLEEEWTFRRGLAEGLSTPSMEALMAAAREAGALGGKACGAGGGGSLAFWVSKGTRLAVEHALEREGARLLLAHPVSQGHVVEVEE